MKEAKLQYSIKLPDGYNTVLNTARKYLSEHPDLIGKYSGKIIFISDVFQWGLDMIADHLELDFKNIESIEIVDQPKTIKNEEWLLNKLDDDPVFRKECYQIISKFSKEQLDDYEANYKPKGISSVEYWNLIHI